MFNREEFLATAGRISEQESANLTQLCKEGEEYVQAPARECVK